MSLKYTETILALMYKTMYIDGVENTYSIADARTVFPAIVDAAESGHEIEVTRRGKAVAVIVSVRTYARLKGSRTRFTQAYARFQRRHSLKEAGLPREFAAALRDRSPGRPVTL